MADPKYKEVGDPMTRTIEECSELIKEICKAQRFGLFNWHPEKPELFNIGRIRTEMLDVEQALKNLSDRLIDEERKYFRERGKTTT